MVNLQACNRQTAPTAPPLPSTQLVAATNIPESINHLSLKLFLRLEIRIRTYNIATWKVYIITPRG